MKRIALFGAAALGLSAPLALAGAAWAAPIRAFDAATGSPVVASVRPMSDAEAGVSAAADPGFKSEALAFEVAAPGFETRIVFQNRKALEAGAAPRAVALCRNGALDSDGDALCDDAEAAYGTDPANVDSDGDRLTDAAELFGWNGFDLAFDGARPTAVDIFLEVDFYPGFSPVQAGLNEIVKSFRNAPTTNPDGTTGINLVIDADDQIRPQDAKADLNPVFTDLAVLERIYRGNAGVGFWAVLANRYNSGGSGGIARGIPGDALTVTLGAFGNRDSLLQSSTLMHELGHLIGLRHGGTDNLTYKPNYLSIMHYSYALRGLKIDGVDGVLDYSRTTIAGVNEANLNESAAFTPIGKTTEADLARYSVKLRSGPISGNASQNLDFNKDGRLSPNISLDSDGDGRLSAFPASQFDWGVVRFDGGGKIGARMPGAQFMPASALLMSADEMPPCMSEND